MHIDCLNRKRVLIPEIWIATQVSRPEASRVPRTQDM